MRSLVLGLALIGAGAYPAYKGLLDALDTSDLPQFVASTAHAAQPISLACNCAETGICNCGDNCACANCPKHDALPATDGKLVQISAEPAHESVTVHLAANQTLSEPAAQPAAPPAPAVSDAPNPWVDDTPDTNSNVNTVSNGSGSAGGYYGNGSAGGYAGSPYRGSAGAHATSGYSGSAGAYAGGGYSYAGHNAGWQPRKPVRRFLGWALGVNRRQARRAARHAAYSDGGHSGYYASNGYSGDCPHCN